MQTDHGARTDSPCIGRGRPLTTLAAIMSVTNAATAATTGSPRNAVSLCVDVIIHAVLPNAKLTDDEERADDSRFGTGG